MHRQIWYHCYSCVCDRNEFVCTHVCACIWTTEGSQSLRQGLTELRAHPFGQAARPVNSGTRLPLCMHHWSSRHTQPHPALTRVLRIRTHTLMPVQEVLNWLDSSPSLCHQILTGWLIISLSLWKQHRGILVGFAI